MHAVQGELSPTWLASLSILRDWAASWGIAFPGGKVFDFTSRRSDQHIWWRFGERSADLQLRYMNGGAIVVRLTLRWRSAEESLEEGAVPALCPQILTSCRRYRFRKLI